MRNILGALLAAVVIGGAGLGSAGAAAQDATVVGELTRIELAADQRSAIATLKNTATGEELRMTITDDLTLDKLKDKRIVEGDEIRTRYERKDGGNASKTFKKTAGC